MKFNCGAKEILLLVAAAGLAALVIPFMLRRQDPAAPPPQEPLKEKTPAPPPDRAPSPPAAPVPSDPLREWPSAIKRRDEKAVLGAQATFLAQEEKYREPLLKMAKEDPDPRVRAFSIAVLGRMKSPPPEDFFLSRLGDAQEYPRTSALQALERLGTAACLAELDRLASSDPAESVRAAASKAAKAVRSR